MNLFGKILVVCNLLVAMLAVYFFMSVRPKQIDWKANSEAKDQQLTVMRQSNQAKDGTIEALNLQVKSFEAARNEAIKKLAVQEEGYKDALAAEKALKEAALLDVTAAVLTTQQAQEKLAGKELEITGLSQALQRSERDKVTVLETANKYRREAADYKTERELTHQQNLNLRDLLSKNQKLILELTKNNAGGAGAGTTYIAKNPNDPNPPPVKVKGEIMAVSRDRNDGAGYLVKLSVGKDHGVNKNHTLDVYRTFPTPEYLGRVRITDVSERDSIGRLVGRGAANNPNLRVGDLVVDTVASLTRQ